MKITGQLCENEQAVTITIEGERIAAVEAAEWSTPGDPAAVGGQDVWIAPGFIDTQFNGYGGYDFNHDSWTTGRVTEDAPHRIVELAARGGTPMLCPTIVTNTREGMLKSCRELARAVENDHLLQHAFPGIHVEGPYISSEDGARGAHPLESVRDPDWDEFQKFQEAANGLIKILTLSPERTGVLPFIEKATVAGVVISIGHTAASAGQIQDAVKAGAQMSTHLGNGSHAMIPRHDNYIWEQLAADELSAGIIADGHHLPPAVVKCFARGKGEDRLVLVSDAVAIGGLPAGIYDNGRHEILPSGKVVLAGTPYLAGAGHLLDTCVANALRWTELGMSGIAKTTSTNPARLLGLRERKGKVAVGYDADFTLFREAKGDGPIEIVGTVLGGEVLYRA